MCFSDDFATMILGHTSLYLLFFSVVLAGMFWESQSWKSYLLATGVVVAAASVLLYLNYDKFYCPSEDFGEFY